MYVTVWHSINRESKSFWYELPGVFKYEFVFKCEFLTCSYVKKWEIFFLIFMFFFLT